MRIKLSKSIIIKDIISTLKPKQCTMREDISISVICTNSKIVEENDLFIAIRGERFDGNDYVEDAIKKGAFVISNRDCQNGITVTDTRVALLSIAKLFIDSLPNIKHKIAITGSVGKTTTKNIINILASTKYVTHSTNGNYNNEIGVAHTLLTAPINTEVLVVECGMNHKGEISRLSRCIQPNIAIITNIGSSHIGNLGSINEIKKAKLEIINGLNKNGILLYEKDTNIKPKNVLSYSVSTKNKGAKYYLQCKNVRLYKNSIKLYVDQKRRMKARVKIPGSHNLNSLLFSIAVCNQIDIPFNKIKKSLSKIDVSVTRYKEYHTEDFDIFDDSYNSALESIKSDIHMLKKHKKNLCVVFGDILETGEKTRYINKSLAYFLAEENIKQYYLYGNNAEYISKLLTKKGVDPKQVFVNSKVEDPQITLDQIKRNHIKGSTILLKSSHNEPLNFIIDYFVKQNITRKK